MRQQWLALTIGGLLLVTVYCGLAGANPAMLPEHPGYQMHNAKDPVTGLPVANDPGQAPLPVDQAIQQAASYHDKQAVQEPTETYESLEYQGAGVLPKTKGYPEYKITPLAEAINPNK
ncbi:MAG: hypothetical protein D6704_04350 [Nitrospirae bacterium]|nr:MAG: hypothetical protein D6704_04350 [Nitrospirota bacterium]